MIKTSTYKIISIAAAILFFLQIGFSTSSTTGHIVTHTNQAYYITGDAMRYKLYLPENFKNHNKVLRICFSNENNEVLNETFIRTGHLTTISSELEIPLDLSSGIYYMLISSHSENLKKEIVLSEIPIPVYSDLQNDLKTVQSNQEFTENSLDKNAVEGLIKINSNQISRREKIIGTVDLSNSRAAAQTSITVNDTQLQIPGYKTVFESAQIDTQLISGLSDKLYLSGKIISSEKNEAKKFPVIAIFEKEQNNFSYLQTDKSGSFHFTSDDYFGHKDIQFINYDNEDITVVINNPEISNKDTKLIFTKEIQNHLELSRKRKKINQLFASGLQTQDFQQTLWEKKSIGDSKYFDFEKYEAFEDISAFFGEILSALKFTQLDDETYRAQVFNRDRASRGYYKGTPVFIIDGTITKDASFVNAIDYNKVNSIEIVSDLQILKETYGPIGYNGIIYITTSLPKIRIPSNEMDDMFKLKGFTSITKTQDGSTLKLEDGTPNFNSNIYWIDELASNTDGSLSFEFEHTDDLGEFEIELISVSNSGELTRSTILYKVE